MSELKSFSLWQFQDEVYKWSEKNFGDQDTWKPLLGVCEEVGELCHAHLKIAQGIRGNQETLEIEARDAVGDIMIYLADYCARKGYDLQRCVENAWEIVRERDWKEKPLTG